MSLPQVRELVFTNLLKNALSEAWPLAGLGEPAAAVVSVVAGCGAAAVAESAAGVSVRSVASLPRSLFADRGAGGRSPAAVGAFAVPGPASVEAFAAVAGIFGPPSRFPCWEGPGAPSAGGLLRETCWRDGCC